MGTPPRRSDGRQRSWPVLLTVRTAILTLICLTLVVASAAAQTRESPPAEPAPPTVDPDQLPIDVGRIQQQLKQQPAIDLELTRPIFRAEIIERQPKWLGAINWLGDRPLPPAPTMPAWHNEFLNMVTPPQARMWGQSRDGELLQLAATSIVQALVTQALVSKVRHAAADRRAAEARDEVDAALAAWQRQQEGTGRPSGASGSGPSPGNDGSP